MTQYDLCLDSSRFSMEQIVEIVKDCHFDFLKKTGFEKLGKPVGRESSHSCEGRFPSPHPSLLVTPLFCVLTVLILLTGR